MGLLMIKDLSTGWFNTIHVGYSMNNAVCLSQHQENVRITVCNSDHTVSVFTVPGLERIQTLNMPCAINCSKCRILLVLDFHFWQ